MTLNETASRIIDREVYVCLSSLVATLASGGVAIEDTSRSYGKAERAAMRGLTEQALELSMPIPDYEGAAREAGWKHSETSWRVFWHEEKQHVSACYKSAGNPEHAWEALCADHDIEPHEIEIYEHWAVSSWLAEKLIAKGEKVDTDFAGMCVWARTTTGQAISADAVILEIAQELSS